MLRFFGICAVVAALCVVAVIGAGSFLTPIPTAVGNKNNDDTPRPESDADLQPVRGEEATQSKSRDDEPLKIVKVIARPRPTQGLILPDGRVLPADRVDLPSEREGTILFLATPAHQGEYVPADKLIVRTVTLMGVKVQPGEKVKKEDLIVDPRNPTIEYRQPLATDNFEAGSTAIIPVSMRFRRLGEDDPVEEGQILGIIRPDLQVEDLKIKQSKVEAAVAERKAAESTREEMVRLVRVSHSLASRNAITKDEVAKTEVQAEKAKSEEVAKRSGVEVSQREMSAEWTKLRLHIIRAPMAGTIRTLYKQPGEAVKNMEPVLLLQNTRRLRVEAQIEVQDAMPLRERLDQARRYREEANKLSREASSPAGLARVKELRGQADSLVAVQIEASRPQPPVAVLRGHLQEVTCVAVSRGPNARIISGSDEGIVRIWERVPGEERWEERVKINHNAPLRALACTGIKAKKNLLLTATSTGRVRLFDLDNLSAGEMLMADRHQGAVTAAAFNADGTIAATGGDDRNICLWNTGNQKRILRKAGAHQSGITSLEFTPAGLLVSAGRDKRLVIWKMEEGNGGDSDLTEVDRLPPRSGDVARLGLDPTGEYTLFDEGRELRVVSLANRRIEGSLANSGATGGFSTLALFSPDGKTVLTNGNAAGRLQLWRAPSATTRAAELRQFLWSSGLVNCGAFDPSGDYAVTGTSDHNVLVWKMPSMVEASRPVKGELTYVEGFLDTSLKRVTVRATLDNSNGWVIPGAAASIVVPPLPQK